MLLVNVWIHKIVSSLRTNTVLEHVCVSVRACAFLCVGLFKIWGGYG